jgi:hypothetical protein
MKLAVIWIPWLAHVLGMSLAMGQSADSLRPPRRSLLDLPDAQQLLVDGEDNLILLDSDRGRLYRYLAAYDYDSSLFIGGKSNRDEGLVHPSKVSLVNRQELYLLDEALGRLLVLNVNLKVIRRSDFLANNPNSNFGQPQDVLFPTSFTIGPTGEQFLINRSDNRVVKINQLGEEELRFGGPDYGPGALYAPVAIEVDGQNFVFVADTAAQVIQVYDLYGVWRYELRLPVTFRWQQMRLFRPYLMCFNQDQLAIYHLQRDALVAMPFALNLPILDVALTSDRFYLLSRNAVHLYLLPK